MEITINKRGQITIPKKIRDIAGLKPSKKLSLKYRNNKIYIEEKTLKPRIFDDKFINTLIEENKISKKEYDRILSKWKNKKSS